MKTHLRSPFVWSTGRKWRFRLEEDFRINLGMGWKGTHEFWDNGEYLAKLVDDDLTIFSGFAWNGCSPAWCVFGVWVGTPTPKAAMVGSLTHDLLFQWMDCQCVPWNLKSANDIFYDLLVEDQWRLKGTYHGAVNLFGAIYRRYASKNPNAKCTVSHEKPV